MVEIEAIIEDENMGDTPVATTSTNDSASSTNNNGYNGNDSNVSASKERLLDAEAIEEVVKSISRPTARMHLEGLAKKLRKEAEALQRLEQQASSSPVDATSVAAPNTTKNTTAAGESVQRDAATSAQPLTTNTKINVPLSSASKYITIDTFSFDFGGYNAAFVTVYVDLNGVGSIDRSQIQCHFTENTFDLVVHDLKGKSYRLVKDNLEKDILPEKSKIVVKSNKIVVKLAKKKLEYGGYEYWTTLTAKKTRSKQTNAKDEDPQKSIMQLMKDMYDEGDDQMKKVIGEAFMKQQRGELEKDKPDFGKLDDF